MVRKPGASDSAFTVKLSPRGASRLKDGHVWVYRSDIVSADGVPPGSVVSVVDHRGQTLGTALYSSSSQIALRLISHEPVADFAALLRQRIADSIAYREPIVQNTNAYRVVFSETDFVPGLDRRPLQRHSLDADPYPGHRCRSRAQGPNFRVDRAPSSGFHRRARGPARAPTRGSAAAPIRPDRRAKRPRRSSP